MPKRVGLFQPPANTGIKSRMERATGGKKAARLKSENCSFFFLLIRFEAHEFFSLPLATCFISPSRKQWVAG
jgi:hypothetical protein